MGQLKIENTIPLIFIDRVSKILPSDCDLKGCFTPRPYKAFRINTLKSDRREVEEFLNDRDISFNSVPWCPSAFTVPISFIDQILGSTLSSPGKIYAQGLESMLAVVVLDPKPGEMVLDLCAAPGSKTTQIAALMQNEGALLANEPVRNRFFRLKSVIDLMGAKASLASKDGRFFRSQQLFDRILVDAPCSSEGRFLWSEPKTFAYWSLRKVREMAHKQKGLLLNASRLLKPGGVMVYATCTFAPEENEEAIEWFLKKTGGRFQLQPINIPGILSYPSSVKHALRVLPSADMEGFFIAKIST